MQGYKDSGVEWIREIPESWRVDKIKYFLQSFFSGVWGEEEGELALNLPCIRVADFDFDKMSLKDEELTIRSYSYSQVRMNEIQSGDILLEKSGGGEKTPVGRVVYNTQYNGVLCANFISVLRCKFEVKSKYACYLIKSSYLSGLSKYLLNQTIGIQNLPMGEFLNQKVCMPSLEDQLKIADFLDKECERIDRIIDKIEKQIEILKEYKRALITETVTKGLNKNVKMKDSGVEWIGEVPGYWKIDKVKYIANLYGRIGWQGLTSDEYIEEGPYLITGVDFSKGTVDWNNCVHISEERWNQASKVKIKNGDLLITKDGTVGKVALVNNLIGKASLNSGVLLIDLNIENNKKFLFWVLSSEVFWTWFNYKNSGNNTILHLYQKDFNEFKFAMPSLKEQQQIADFLDQKCSEIDLILSKKANQLDIIKEHKKSLIYEYVTGKKRVGGIENGD